MADSVLLRLIDFVLLLPFFFVFSIAIPLIDSQICVPSNWVPLHPKLLIDLKTQYGEKFGDYLFIEKPFFFVGLIWVEIFLLWPLSIVCTYGILTKKQWFQKTCLVAGVSCVTGMVCFRYWNHSLFIVKFFFVTIINIDTQLGLCPLGWIYFLSVFFTNRTMLLILMNSFSEISCHDSWLTEFNFLGLYYDLCCVVWFLLFIRVRYSLKKTCFSFMTSINHPLGLFINLIG